MGEAIDRQIAAAARPCGGYVTRRRLLGLGLSARQITYRVRCGRLHPEYHGVYAVGHRPVLPVDRAHGALLAAGPRAVLSHRSAASLHRLVNDWQFPFEVTTVEDRRVKGITIHRSTTLKPRDLTVQLGPRSPAGCDTSSGPGYRPTRSELERASRRWCRTYDIPVGVINDPYHWEALHLDPAGEAELFHAILNQRLQAA